MYVVHWKQNFKNLERHFPSWESEKRCDMESRFDIIVKGRIVGTGEISGESSDLITIYDVKEGTIIYLEAAKEPLIRARSHNKWKSNAGTTGDMNHESVKLGTLGKFVKSFHDTKRAKMMGELPNFLILTATEDKAWIKIGTHIGMKVMPFTVNEVPLLLKSGAFMMAQNGIGLKQRIISGDNEKKVSELLGFRYFQEISGHGVILIEGFKDIESINLYPGEEIAVDPKCLIGYTETVQITDVWTMSDQPKIRSAEGTDFNLILKANVCGGIVIISHTRQELPKKNK